MKKVLAFFGAFNPPTRAHLELARLCAGQTGRDGVIFVPSKMDYIQNDQHKDFSFSDEDRYRMLQSACMGDPSLMVCDWELKQPHQPRTYETLCHLRDEGFSPSLLMGSDKLPELEHGWLYVPEIVREFGIVCMSRDLQNVKSILHEDPFLHGLSGGIQVVESPAAYQTISSTRVRRILKEIARLKTLPGPADEAALQQIQEKKAALAGLVPEPVLDILLSKAFKI